MLGMRRVVGMGRVFVRVLLVEPFVMTVIVVSAFAMSVFVMSVFLGMVIMRFGAGRSFGRSGGSLDRCVGIGWRCRRFARGMIVVIVVRMTAMAVIVW